MVFHLFDVVSGHGMSLLYLPYMFVLCNPMPFYAMLCHAMLCDVTHMHHVLHMYIMILSIYLYQCI